MNTVHNTVVLIVSSVSRGLFEILSIITGSGSQTKHPRKRRRWRRHGGRHCVWHCKSKFFNSYNLWYPDIISVICTCLVKKSWEEQSYSVAYTIKLQFTVPLLSLWTYSYYNASIFTMPAQNSMEVTSIYQAYFSARKIPK